MIPSIARMITTTRSGLFRGGTAAADARGSAANLPTPGRPASIIARFCGPGRRFIIRTNTALGPTGDIYVADGYGNARVHHFTPDGHLLHSWGSRAAGRQFYVPHGIAVGKDGTVYGPTVKIAASSYLRRRASIRGMDRRARPCQIFIDPSGWIYVAELGFRAAGAGLGPGSPEPGATGGRVSIFDARRFAGALGWRQQSPFARRLLRPTRHLGRCSRRHLRCRSDAGRRRATGFGAGFVPLFPKVHQGGGARLNRARVGAAGTMQSCPTRGGRHGTDLLRDYRSNAGRLLDRSSGAASHASSYAGARRLQSSA